MHFQLYSFYIFVYLLHGVTSVQIPITIQQNGYQGLTIAISSNIQEDVGLIQKIKDWVISASRVLYKATKNQLYYKEVSIVLPKTWSVQTGYQKISGQKFTRAHVRVDKENPVVGKTPYVYGQTACGEPGQYLHLTPYILYAGELAGYGEIGNVFVHEWGHLRWGLFDEYSTFEEASLEIESGYYLEGGTWKAVRCTDKITGTNININTGQPCIISSDGIPETDCVFIPDQNSATTASLMGHQNIKQMEQFCDVDNPSTGSAVRHNSKAPNNQNRRCNYRSAWEVMRGHSDFQGISPGGSSLDTTPQFTVEIETDQTICLLLDVSGSMQTNERISKMFTASSNFLRNMVQDGSSVVIVTFSGIANVVHNLIKINGPSDRESLVSSLPKSTGGATSIGAGILSCMQTLNTSTNTLQGSMIYLVTDGEETRDPRIADVQPSIESSGVIINTLALGGNADLQLGSISRASGGQSFFYSETQDSTVLTDAFAATVTGSDVPYQIASDSLKLSSTNAFERSVTLDPTVGRQTEFQLTTSGTSGSSPVTVTVTGPDQTSYSETSSSGLVTLAIPGTAQVGSYKVRVTTTSNIELPVVLNVQSKSRVVGEDSITITAGLSSDTHVYSSSTVTTIYVSVLKGMSPVLKCNVTAVVEDLVTSSINLADNGIGSDIRENDGIYTGYIFSFVFNRNGRHSIKVYIENLNNKAEVMTVAQTSQSTVVPYLRRTTTPTDNFQRVLLANELLITNYTSGPLPDTIPPAKIYLKLKSVTNQNGEVVAVIEWKAVGDDLDIGTAQRYDARISDSFTRIEQNPTQEAGFSQNIPTPSSAGNVDVIEVRLQDASTTKFIVIRAIDNEQNAGEFSNIISITALTDANWVAISGENNLSLVGTLGSSISAAVMLVVMIFVAVCIKKKWFIHDNPDKKPQLLTRDRYNGAKKNNYPYHIPYDHSYSFYYGQGNRKTHYIV